MGIITTSSLIVDNMTIPYVSNRLDYELIQTLLQLVVRKEVLQVTLSVASSLAEQILDPSLRCSILHQKFVERSRVHGLQSAEFFSLACLHLRASIRPLTQDLIYGMLVDIYLDKIGCNVLLFIYQLNLVFVEASMVFEHENLMLPSASSVLDLSCRRIYFSTCSFC